MESARIDELAAQAVAWHNRHRLASRVASAHVRSVGVVVLPFVSRAASDSPSAGPFDDLEAAFSDNFIAPLTPKQVAAFALRHGSRERPGADGWPQRVVPTDAEHASAKLVLLHLRTASFESGDQRCRVLIGDGLRPEIIGPRVWSVPRIAGASAVVTAMLAGIAFSMVPTGPREPPAARAAWAALPALPASMPAALPASPRASMPARVLTRGGRAEETRVGSALPLITASSAPAAAASTPPWTAHPQPSAPVEPEVRRRLSEIRPELGAEARATALLEGRRLRTMAPLPKVMPMTHEARRIYAVVTTATRSRAGAEQGHQIMDLSVESDRLSGKPRGDLMQVANGWRAVLWPFRTREDAQAARTALSRRGVRTEVLEF